MHFQVGDGMAKLVRCARGAIVDVVVDLRRGSPTFGEWEAFELNDENLHQLYCPIGFAHGFCVTSDLADVMYKCSGYYDESIERGIKYDDPEIGIQWPDVELIPSDRDANAPRLSEIARRAAVRVRAFAQLRCPALARRSILDWRFGAEQGIQNEMPARLATHGRPQAAPAPEEYSLFRRRGPWKDALRRRMLAVADCAHLSLRDRGRGYCRGP